MSRINKKIILTLVFCVVGVTPIKSFAQAQAPQAGADADICRSLAADYASMANELVQGCRKIHSKSAFLGRLFVNIEQKCVDSLKSSLPANVYTDDQIRKMCIHMASDKAVCETLDRQTKALLGGLYLSCVRLDYYGMRQQAIDLFTGGLDELLKLAAEYTPDLFSR